MRVAIVTTRDVLVIALARLLGLPNGVWTPLDRQVVRRLRCGPRLLHILWTALPLPAAMRLLLGAILFALIGWFLLTPLLWIAGLAAFAYAIVRSTQRARAEGRTTRDLFIRPRT